MSSTLNLIPVLTGDNWILWSDQMKAYLMSQGLWLLTKGEDPIPSEAAAGASAEVKAATDKEILEWKKRDGQAIGAIMLRIAASLRIHQQDTSKKFWDELEKQFGKITHGTAYAWAMKLINFRITDTESPVKQFSVLDTILSQVKANKITIDEYFVALLITRDLPKRYENLG